MRRQAQFTLFLPQRKRKHLQRTNRITDCYPNYRKHSQKSKRRKKPDKNVQEMWTAISPKKISRCKWACENSFRKTCHLRLHIKTTMRYHNTPVRMGKIQNTDNTKCWQACGAKGPLIHCWWECKIVQPLCKKVWWFLMKLKIILPYHPALKWVQNWIHQNPRRDGTAPVS